MNFPQIEFLNTLSTNLSVGKFREFHDCIFLGKVIRIEVFLKDVSRISEYANKLNLSFSISDKSFKTIVDRGMDVWSSSVSDCSDNDSNAMRFVFLHANKEVCELAKQFDTTEDDLNLGLLLNYPRCCIESYLNWQKDNEDIDPITTITNSFQFTGHLPIMNFPNPFSRYFGSGLFSHFPCSLNCFETKRKATESFDSIKVNFPTIANQIFHLENSLIIFNKEKGVCLWTNFHLEKNKICIYKNSFHGQGELKLIFKSIDEIELSETELKLNSNSVKVNVLKANGYFIGAFNYTAK